MTASGWRTAPPQNPAFGSDAVLVTNSRCLLSLEASLRGSDLHFVAQSTLFQSAATAHLIPVIAHAASASRILSAPTVSHT